MKKITFLILLFLLSVTAFLYSQPTDIINKTQFVNGNEGILGPQCVGGLVYDDNTWENGYGFGPNFGTGKYVMSFTPSSYPFTINQVCLALTRLSTGPANWTFDIVVYDQTGTGGSPGNLLVTVANQTATNLPIWPTVSWFDFTNLTGMPAITSGSVYVGFSFDPPPTGNPRYIGADESATTTQRPGYGYIQSAWSTIQSFFSNYRAIGVRCEGTNQAYAHNIGVGPFLSLPGFFNVGVTKAIKAKILNLGTSNESGIPIKFFVNGTQTGSISINLNAGAVDSVSFNWTPTDTGTVNLRIVSALSNDESRYNDTVSANVRVYPFGYIYSCWATGTTPAGYPFYTSYHESRTDMLYLADEIGFLNPPTSITAIGFNIVTAAPQVMNGFHIKMQNTTMTTITAFTPSGWTDVYSANYAVPGTGIQMIQLQTPFYYTGNNLLIEICFTDSTSTSNSSVNSTVVSGRVIHNHFPYLLYEGCEITQATGQTALPNICLIGNMLGINNNNKVPEKFSLSQNYPNPFNPSTIINYQLPMNNYVKLTIFDALGREAAVLVNEKQSAGSYNVEWDGTNYSSGLYFYKLECEGFTEVKKLVLIK
jgi:hypothetical protein